MDVNVFYGILIPFLGTSAGAACVFFMKKNLNEQVQRALTGFAAGVMVAASVWSLLIPAIRTVCRHGEAFFCTGSVGTVGRGSVSAFAGSCDSASSSEQ